MIERWSPQKKYALDHVLEAPGIFVVTTDHPLSVAVVKERETVRFGGNRGSYPVKIGTFGNRRKRGRGKEPRSQRRDTITALFDKNPYVRTELKVRFWLPGMDSADALAAAVKVPLAMRAEEEGLPQGLLHDFLNLGPDFNLEQICRDIVAIARSLGMLAWDLAEVSRHLDPVLHVAAIDQVALDSPEFARLIDEMVSRELSKAFPQQGRENERGEMTHLGRNAYQADRFARLVATSGVASRELARHASGTITQASTSF